MVVSLSGSTCPTRHSRSDGVGGHAHSGTRAVLGNQTPQCRFTDARDVVAAAADADFDRVETHLHRGDPEALDEQLASISEQLADESFVDAFKGEFQQQTIPEATIKRVRDFLAAQQERLQ